MITDYILVAAALVWTAVASISDIRKREVANWLNFSLVAIALAVRAAGSVVYNDFYYFLYGLIGLTVFFLIANVFYYTKIFGGGDAKLLVALGVVLATAPEFAKVQTIAGFSIPFLAVFFMNILVLGFFYGIGYSIVIAIKSEKSFVKEFSKLNKKFKIMKYVFIAAALIILVSFYFMKINAFALLAAITLIYPYLFIFTKSVENSCMIKLVRPDELTEGDWLAEKVKIRKNIIKPSADGLSIADIKMIKKAKKKVLVKYGIPFVPVFFLAIIACLFFGNIMAIIVSAIIG